MWDLDDKTQYIKFLSFSLKEAFTYADTRPGHTDWEKRDYIRLVASTNFPKSIPKVDWWAFRIFVRKSGNRQFDIENVPKLIVDAFCKKQITLDGSVQKEIGLYEDDTIDFVRIIQVSGERSTTEDSTIVEIFGKKP
jgi:hypothetical protein